MRGSIWFRLREETEDKQSVLADGGADGTPAAIFPKRAMASRELTTGGC